jgi:ATP-dependent Clp protease protease subunit
MDDNRAGGGVPFGGGWDPPAAAPWGGPLFDRRVVMVSGPLDDHTVGRVAAELMMLDATGDDPVILLVDSPGGTLDAGFAVIDTVSALGVPVHATCVGRAEGVAVGVFAAAEHRLAAPHSRFRISEPFSEVTGPASAISRFAAHQQRRQEKFAAVLAAATGQPAEHVEADLAAGRWLSAAEAVAYGLAHGLWQPSPGPPKRAPGFRPNSAG